MIYWNIFGKKWPVYVHISSMVAIGVLEPADICGRYHKPSEAAVVEVESNAVICEDLNRNGLTET